MKGAQGRLASLISWALSVTGYGLSIRAEDSSRVTLRELATLRLGRPGGAGGEAARTGFALKGAVCVRALESAG